MRGRFRRVAIVAALLVPVSGHADWLTFGKTPERSGTSAQETVLNPTTVPGLRLLWQRQMPGAMLAQPLMAVAPTDRIYVADLTGSVAAFEANTGDLVWSQQLPALPTTCPHFPRGSVGAIGTPTLDPANNRMWVMVADGTLWALALDTGWTLPGYPLQMLDRAEQNGVTINYGGLNYDGDGSLYATSGGQCDREPFNGAVIKVDVGSGEDTPKLAARFALAEGVGVLGIGGVALDGPDVFVATSAVASRPEATVDAVLQLDRDLKLVASSRQSTAFIATPVPYQAASCPPQMAVMNTNGELLIYDRAIGLGAGPVQRLPITPVEAGGDFIGLPAFDALSRQLYVGNPRDGVQDAHGLLAFGVGSTCGISLRWQRSLGNPSSPVAANPMVPPTVANGVVYYATGVASQVVAVGADGTLLWSSGTAISGGIFTAPTVVSGLLLVSGYDGTLTAFAPR